MPTTHKLFGLWKGFLNGIIEGGAFGALNGSNSETRQIARDPRVNLQVDIVPNDYGVGNPLKNVSNL